jgi:hypothetical protein
LFFYSRQQYIISRNLRPPLQVYVEYAHVISRLPELSSIIYHPAYTEVEQEQQYRDQQELDKLVRSVPRLLMSLPELLYDREEPLHKAAKAQMERELVRAIDGERPLAVVSTWFEFF